MWSSFIWCKQGIHKIQFFFPCFLFSVLCLFLFQSLHFLSVPLSSSNPFLSVLPSSLISFSYLFVFTSTFASFCISLFMFLSQRITFFSVSLSFPILLSSLPFLFPSFLSLSLYMTSPFLFRSSVPVSFTTHHLSPCYFFLFPSFLLFPYFNQYQVLLFSSFSCCLKSSDLSCFFSIPHFSPYSSFSQFYLYHHYHPF